MLKAFKRKAKQIRYPQGPSRHGNAKIPYVMGRGWMLHWYNYQNVTLVQSESLGVKPKEPLKLKACCVFSFKVDLQ